jgi:hypothetical protein
LFCLLILLSVLYWSKFLTASKNTAKTSWFTLTDL